MNEVRQSVTSDPIWQANLDMLGWIIVVFNKDRKALR
jgi:hypothetical protein